MEQFSQNGEFFSEERCMGLENFLSVNSFGTFQPYSTPTREERVKEVEVERVERVEERSVQKKKLPQRRLPQRRNLHKLK